MVQAQSLPWRGSSTVSTSVAPQAMQAGFTGKAIAPQALQREARSAGSRAGHAIAAGLASAVLVPYGIRTSNPGGRYAYHAADPLKADLEMPVGYYGQPLYFAMIPQRYRHEFGLEPEQLGSLAVAQREWAARTPNSQKPERITLESARCNPIFQIVTPQQCVEYAKTLEPHGELTFQPLFGGLPPELAWKSLKLFERETIPLLKAAGLR